MVDELPDVVIRPATVDDAERIAAVHIASWRQAYEGVVSDEYLPELDPEVRTASWRDTLAGAERSEVRVWVAEDEDDHSVVGFASLGPSRDEDADRTTLEIYTIYLEPSSWGRGVARDLIRTVLDEVPQQSAVTLWVMAANERAQHFYRRHGFVADGVERLEEIGSNRMREVRYRRG